MNATGSSQFLNFQSNSHPHTQLTAQKARKPTRFVKREATFKNSTPWRQKNTGALVAT